jgi:uncharacterized membrane protein
MVGMALCLYLSVAGFSDSALAGCDPVAGCGRLLTGRWSAWFGLPVSLPACFVYLVIVISSRLVKPEDRTWRLQYSGRFLAATTLLAALAAVWFVAIQFAAERAVCPYCLCLHACGLLAAGLVWQRLRHWPRQLLKPAGAGLAILILGQTVIFRHPYRVDADVVTSARSMPATRPAMDPDRHVRIFVGGKAFDLDPAKLPVLGSPRANHFIVVMSDYTCEHCRVTHRMLERSQRTFGDQVGVIVLPVLLDSAANPYLPAGATHPMPQDRSLTELALAVFCAKPVAFAEMNRWLFAEDRVRGEAEARAYAEKLVGAEALREFRNDPRVRQITLTGCELFAGTGSGMIPRVLIGKMQISGPVDDVNALGNWIEKEWGSRTPSAR